jgi:2-dehydro-3-deoxyphosphogluconate aldolase / (4S)-4-hydroxy-2-oxoglutarate aldolase
MSTDFAASSVVTLLSGTRLLKLFPADLLGGTAMVDALRGPFPDVCFVPTGGIREADIPLYLARSNVAAVGGTWWFSQAHLASATASDVRDHAAALLKLAAQEAL